MLVWQEAMKRKGHMPKMWRGELDTFVVYNGFHQGPGCEVCHWSCCMWCDKVESIPQCDCIDGTLTPRMIEASACSS